MRVLVTRATDEAIRTRDKLAAAGHEVVLSPVIEIIGTGSAWPSGVVDAVLASSAQAFALLAEDPTPEARRLLPLYLVGERTARRARERGFSGAATVAPNAAALVLRLGTLQSHARVIYLAGCDRKPDLEAAVEASGRHLVVVEVYAAQPAAVLTSEAADAICAEAIDVVLHFSPRSAMLFASLADADGLDVSMLQHVCMSDDVAAPLRQRGHTHIAVAAEPNEAALLDLLT